MRHNEGSFLFKRKEFKPNIQSLINSYALKDFQEASMNILEFNNFNGELVQAHVGWLLKNSLGEVFSSFECVYQLAFQEDSELKIFGVINLNETVE